ncbi:hypothetical protein ACW9HR_22135 [Nocardia gipuzkoensis]
MTRRSSGRLGCWASRACPAMLFTAAGIESLSVHACAWLGLFIAATAVPAFYFTHRDDSSCAKCSPPQSCTTPTPRRLRAARRMHVMDTVVRRIWAGLHLPALAAAVCVAAAPATFSVCVWIFVVTITADGLRIWTDRAHRTSACTCWSCDEAPAHSR